MATFEAELRARWGASLHFSESLDSTQQAGGQAGRAGAPEGSVFIAEQQTAGRGRHGQSWISPPGVGIYASLLLRPCRPAGKLLWLTLGAGLGVADAVQATCDLEAEIRWPNDLLIAGKKFCGILTETATGEGGLLAVLGFGINVRAASLPADVSAIATALELHTARPVARGALANAAVEQVLRRYAAWSLGEDEVVRAEFERRSRYARGLAVSVEGRWRGVTEGLDADGFLRVRAPEGELRTVVSGNVRPAAES
ncbi:MAG: biotin--[acetyl-CoA-carboxylase] ligase [Terriglobales bacterium]